MAISLMVFYLDNDILAPFDEDLDLDEPSLILEADKNLRWGVLPTPYEVFDFPIAEAKRAVRDPLAVYEVYFI